VPGRDDIAAGIRRAYDLPAEEAARIPITGGPAEAAERLAGYHAAGAGHLVVGFAGGDWRRQCDLFAEAAGLAS
jgi:alkanesulfonate monooxygenase SsuD/methylene tetrahydromethanopterin reductase-like flavin-dependent oxidoreductase (luciferase family)